MTNLQPEIDNLLHQLAQPSISPFAIADLTNRLQKLLLSRWFEQHPIDAPTCVCGCTLDADGKCPLELDGAALSLVEPALADDDTEDIVPLRGYSDDEVSLINHREMWGRDAWF